MQRFFLWYDRLLNASAYVAAAIIGIAAIATVVDAAMRNFHLGYGVIGIVELTEYGLCFLTLIGAAWVLREGGHISIDIVLEAIGPAARRVADKIVAVLLLVICLGLLVAGVLATLRSIRTGHTISKTFSFPEWWLQVVLPAAALLLVIESLRRLVAPPAPRTGAPPAQH